MFSIGDKEIGKGRTFIVAEAGVNHNGDIGTALKLVKAARNSGADAVKFQSFRAEWMCDFELTETKDVEGVTGGSRSSYDMYKALELSDEGHRQVSAYARELGLICFFSVFDSRSIPLLEELDVPAYKIASGDLTHKPLIEGVTRTGKPVLVSTGMSTYSEVLDLYEWISLKTEALALIHCVSEYPAPMESLNLNVISEWKASFECSIGFSDHSLGLLASPIAVALGAEIIEKHFTLDNHMDGPDHKLSLDPQDFNQMVDSIRAVEHALGHSYKMPSEGELDARENSRRGIKVARELAAGHTLTLEDLAIIKPDSGLSPSFLEDVLGAQLRHDMKKGSPLNWQDLDYVSPE